MKRSWKKRRQTTECSDAERRWDQAYQLLLRWSRSSELQLLPIVQPAEVKDESSDLCACLDAEANSGTID